MSQSLLRRLPTLSTLKRVAPNRTRRAPAPVSRQMWALPVESVDQLLRLVQDTHAVVCVSGALAQRCGMLYMDTRDERCHFDHLRGQLPRVEVRQRQCPLNGATRLELVRFGVDGGEQVSVMRVARFGALGLLAQRWLAERLPFAPSELEASVYSEFTRVTLDDGSGALLTIDLDVAFSAGGSRVLPGGMACVTLSAPMGQRSPLVEQVLRRVGGRATRVAPWALARPMVRLERAATRGRLTAPRARRRTTMPWVKAARQPERNEAAAA